MRVGRGPGLRGSRAWTRRSVWVLEHFIRLSEASGQKGVSLKYLLKKSFETQAWKVVSKSCDLWWGPSAPRSKSRPPQICTFAFKSQHWHFSDQCQRVYFLRWQCKFTQSVIHSQNQSGTFHSTGKETPYKYFGKIPLHWVGPRFSMTASLFHLQNGFFGSHPVSSLKDEQERAALGQVCSAPPGCVPVVHRKHQ